MFVFCSARPPSWRRLARVGGRAAAGALVCLSALGQALPDAKPPEPTAKAGNKAAGKAQPPTVARPDARPRWSELTSPQQRALLPLAASWSHLSEGQKRKWIAVSRNFAELTPDERATLHERMVEWAALSVAERNAARLNFSETKKLSADEKQAKWEAYQALSPDERRKLAQQAPRAPAGAAPAVRLVPAQRLANVPARVDNQYHVPRITTAPNRVDPHTLLPQFDDTDAGLAATSDQ